MTTDQEAHLAWIKSAFAKAAETKYCAGQAEHGGNLWDRTPLQLIEEALGEAIDGVVYLLEARRQLIEPGTAVTTETMWME
jgi:hypothetical protein